MKKLSRMRMLLCAVGFLLTLAAVQWDAGAADFSAFDYVQPCTLSTSGLGLADTVVNFPLLVRLREQDHQELFRRARDDGYDIRFSKSDGDTPLYYEMERWDLSAQDSVAEFWVLMDTIAPDEDRPFLIHAGNGDSSADRSSAAQVFDTANGFAGVWHFAPSDTFGDASVNGYDGTNQGSTASTGGSPIAHGRDFDGSSGYIDVPGFPDSAITDELTISTWVNLDNQDGWNDIISKETGDYGAGFGLRRNNGDRFYFSVHTDAKYEIGDIDQFVDDGSTWYYIAGVCDGSEQIFYIDGGDSASRSETNSIAATTNSLNIGCRSSGVNYIDGRLDEVRISRVGRSPDWIALCYASQQPGASILTFGAVAPRDSTPPNASIEMAAACNESAWVDSGAVVKGTASDDLSGVDSVYVQLLLKDSVYWDGSSWSSAIAVDLPARVAGSDWQYPLSAADLIDGTYMVVAEAVDSMGNRQDPRDTAYFVYDTQAPDDPDFSIEDSSGYTADDDPPLSFASVDPPDSMRLACRQTGETTDWKPWASEDSIDISAAGSDTEVHIRAQYKDIVGNLSSWVEDTTVYDITPPTSSILTSGTFNASTWPSYVEISATADSAIVDSVYVRVRNHSTGNEWDGSSWVADSVWVAASQPSTWQLSLDAGILDDASYSVWAIAVDVVGNRESATPGSFGFDNTPPDAGTCRIVDDDGYTREPAPQVVFTSGGRPPDSLRAGEADGRVDTSALAWDPYTAQMTVDISDNGDGHKVVVAQFKDTVDNRSVWFRDSTVYDVTAPTSSVTTAGTFNPQAWPDTIRGSATDATAGVDSVVVSIRLRGTSRYWQGATWADGERWLDAGGGSSWSIQFPANQFLDTASATYEVRCRAVDRAGNAQQSPSDTTFVFHRTPVADFSPGIPITVAEGSSVEFYDSSWGAIDSWEWDFGDGESSTEQNPVHAYAGTDTTYSVSLTVSGPGGADTIDRTDWVYVVVPGTNPVRLTGRYLSDSTVELTYGSFQQISIDPVGFPPKKVDSLRLYTRAGALPTTQSPGAVKKSYHVPTLQQQGGDRFLDTVSVSPLTGSDSTYGFSTVLWWDNATESDFRQANGFLVLMRDTVAPVHDLSLSGSYSGGDSIEIQLDGVSTIDSIRAASVGVWYGFNQEPDFSSSDQTAWVKVQTVREEASNDVYVWEVQDELFDGVKRELYVYVIVEGTNGLYSTDTSAASFSVGRERPVYSGTVTARAVDAKRIALSWEAVEAEADSVVIWYDTTAIPRRHDVSAPWSISPSVEDTVDTIRGLNSSTTYHFGLQVSKGELWSVVNQASSASAATRKAETGDTLYNTLSVTSTTFDSSRNEIVVAWRSDTTGVEYGITREVHASPPDSRLPAQWSEIDANEDTTRIALGEDIVFEAEYHVSMWMRGGDGEAVEPTDSSKGKAETGPYSWQPVGYFDQDVPRDTVRGFNGDVLLWKDSLYDPRGRIPVVADTLFYENVPSSGWEGMAALGGVVSIAAPEQTPAFFLGLRYDRSKIPDGYGAGDIRVYRSGKDGTVSAVRTSGVDSTMRMVWVKTDDFSVAFTALVDTVEPDTAFLTNLNTVIRSSSDTVRDTFVISDNAGDVRWWLYYDRGDRALFGSEEASGRLSARSETLSVAIPGAGAEDSGIRGALVIDDGRYRDTIDVSRRARRLHSDELTTAEMEWFPLYVTAELEKPSLRHVLAGEAASSFDYDTRDIRLFRWYPHKGNEGESDKWVEYSSSGKDLFEFTPGRLIWVKTAEHRSIDFGEGVTLSLQDTFSLTLPAEEWTDFGLPYLFDVRVRDVVGATGARGDSLEYYRWKRTGPRRGDSMYVTDLLYARGISETDTVVLESGSGAANTVYNPLEDSVILRIPPIPPVMSPVIVDTGGAESKKRQNKEKRWRVRVSPSLDRGPHLSTIYCGYEPGGSGTRYYAAPPSFFPLRAGVHARRTMFGHAVAREAPHGGCAFELVFRNDASRKRTVRCVLDTTEVKGEAWILDPVSREWEANDDNVFSVAVKGNWSEYRWLVVGDARYRDYFLNSLPSWRLDLMRVHAAAGGRSVLMRYSVPYGGMRSLEFAAFDAAGRLVWRHCVEGAGLQRGVHTVVWDTTPSAAGMYVIRMRAVDADTKRRGFTRVLPLVR